MKLIISLILWLTILIIISFNFIVPFNMILLKEIFSCFLGGFLFLYSLLIIVLGVYIFKEFL